MPSRLKPSCAGRLQAVELANQFANHISRNPHPTVLSLPLELPSSCSLLPVLHTMLLRFESVAPVAMTTHCVLLARCVWSISHADFFCRDGSSAAGFTLLLLLFLLMLPVVIAAVDVFVVVGGDDDDNDDVLVVHLLLVVVVVTVVVVVVVVVVEQHANCLR